jgi:hypothetical protein
MKLKEIFHSENERELLAHNGLGSFESLWDLEGHFIEEPNYRRGGQKKNGSADVRLIDLEKMHSDYPAFLLQPMIWEPCSGMPPGLEIHGDFFCKAI